MNREVYAEPTLEEERRKYAARMVFGSDEAANTIRTKWENLKRLLEGNLQSQLDEVFDALLMSIPSGKKVADLRDKLSGEKLRLLDEAIEHFNDADKEVFDQTL